MEAIIAAVGSAGLSSALVIFFVYRNDLRYDKLNDFVTQTLVQLVAHNQQTADRVATALESLAKETTEFHTTLKARPCQYNPDL